MTKDAIPIACTLEGGQLPARVELWRSLLRQATAPPEATASGWALRFERRPGDLGQLASLVDDELTCCAFFTFSLTASADSLVLDISAPPKAAHLARELAHLGTDTLC
jgi:hypothetical protein